MISKFLKYLLDICVTAWDYIMALFYAHIVPDWHFFFWTCLLAAIVLGSAFLAATIAESRNHKMKLHFLLGLLVPYIYPLVLALRLKMAQAVIDAEDEIDPLSGLSSDITDKFKNIQNATEEEQKKRRTRLKPKTEEEEEQNGDDEDESAGDKPVEVEPAEPEAVVQEETPVFTQRHFQDIAVDSSGAKVGPFRLVTQNGSEFKVCHIKNIQKDMASFEVEVKGSIKNIRIKYDNIKIFDKIN